MQLILLLFKNIDNDQEIGVPSPIADLQTSRQADKHVLITERVKSKENQCYPVGFRSLPFISFLKTHKLTVRYFKPHSIRGYLIIKKPKKPNQRVYRLILEHDTRKHAALTGIIYFTTIILVFLIIFFLHGNQKLSIYTYLYCILIVNANFQNSYA